MTPKVDSQAVRQAIEVLPLLSPSVTQLLQTLAREGYEIDDVVQIIKYDAALTARVLRTVNSPIFGLLNPVTSLERAISYLGERVIISIVLADQCGDMFTRPLPGYDGQQSALWRHDLFCAFASREMAGHARLACEPGLAFTAGLLHDIGKFVFSPFWAAASGEALERIEQGQVTDYLQAEQLLAGLDHAEVGFAMARHWQFPEALQAAIRYHHAPGLAPEEFRMLSYAVHLGDMLAMMAGADTGSDGMQYQLDGDYAQYFDVSSQDLAVIMLDAEEHFKKAEASLAVE